MPFKLRVRRSRDEATDFLFEHHEDAVEYAVVWFWSGYNALKDEYLAERLPTESRQLRNDLENCREYRCDFLQVIAAIAAICPAISKEDAALALNFVVLAPRI